MSKNFSFPKYLKLKKQNHFELLAAEGNKILYYPLLAKWLIVENPSPYTICLKVAFAVSKRRIKKAFYRNKIRRRIRESFRKNKQLILQSYTNNKCILILFIYLPNKILNYSEINIAMQSILAELNSKI
jgi:ribonuclease P protein component